MQRRLITFHGTTKMDRYGVPMPFHRYFVVATNVQNLGSGKSVASVQPITNGAPKLAGYNFIGSSEKDAINKAAAALRALPGNKGLKESLNF
jgi:hypothetical protein